MSYQIITDSGCDFTKEKYEALGLIAAPLTVNFRGETYPDRNDDSLRDMYAGLRAGEAASTAAANPQQWEEALEPVLASGEDALILAFSSGLSTTYQSACIAAEDLKSEYPDAKIVVIDSLSASRGQGMLLYRTVQERRRSSPDIETLAAYVRSILQTQCHWFTVNDLMYLKRGGRINAATAIMGTMLSIKPILHVDNEGHLVSVGKARGRKASIAALADKAAELGKGYDNSLMFISHGDCLEDAQALAELVKERCGVKEVYINYVGAVIGSHSGPGTLALFFLGQHR